MNIKEVLAELDELFDTHRVDEVEEFLQNKLLLAKNERDTSAMITIVNELIGFYRDMGKFEQAISYCNQVITLMKQCGYEGTVPYATTLLNVANAKRAAGLFDEAEEAYQGVLGIYQNQLEQNDYRYADLYNNWSLLYQEQEEFGKARDSLQKALGIISCHNNTQLEIAATQTNLATTLLHLGEIKEAVDYLILALSIFEEDGGNDYHYSAALSAMGDAKYLQGDYIAAADYYEHACKQLESHVGRTEAYQRITDNLEIVREKIARQEESDRKEKSVAKEEKENKAESNQLQFLLEEPSEDDFDEDYEDDFDIDCEDDFERSDYENSFDYPKEKEKDFDSGKMELTISEEDYDDSSDTGESPASDRENVKQDTILPLEKKGLKLSEEFYEAYGKAMIHEKFPEYESRIAVGLVGEGSECYGFDDALSLDKDYRTGFAMWVTKETYEEIGEQLQRAYEELLAENEVQLMPGNNSETIGCGVCIIDDFYKRIIGLEHEPQSEFEWYQIPSGALASAINGKVFRDDEYIFSGIRKKIQYLYPEKVRLYKIAEELAGFSQTGQYNYARMMIRKDYVTASILVSKFIQHTMKLVYLLNRTYEPYFKWQRIAMKKLAILPEIGELLEEIVELPVQKEAWEGLDFSCDLDKPNDGDPILLTIERIAALLLGEMRRQGLTTGEDTYLDHHRQSILCLAEDAKMLAKVRKLSKERVFACIENKQVVCDPQREDFDMARSEMETETSDLYENDFGKQILDEMEYQSFIPYSPSVPKELMDEGIKEIEIFVNRDPFLSFQRESDETGKTAAALDDSMTEMIFGNDVFEQKKEDEAENRMNEKEKSDLIEKIVALEWKQFDVVQNEGGRASCQDDWNTFSIMRKSQYMAWKEDVLESFYRDLSEADARGWNLIMEKYARMMESTAPIRYKELKESLPVISEEKKNVSEQIIQIQVGWMETFAKAYPNMAGNARNIHTSEDTPFNTSYETYLRGELLTYSDETLALYGKMIVDLSREGKNLAKMIMTNTALLYGYESIEDAEERLKN